MRERLLRPLGQCSKLHKLLVLFTLLLTLPLSAWGESYQSGVLNIDGNNITWGAWKLSSGTSYSSPQKNYLSFSSGSTITLTLTRPDNITDLIQSIDLEIGDGISNITLLSAMIGTNDIKGSFTTNSGVFTYSPTIPAEWSGDIVITLQSGSASGSIMSATVYTVAYYGVKVAGIPVTSANNNNVIPGSSTTVTYDDQSNTLTLNGATIDYTTGDAIAANNTSTLNINLLGTNSISCGEHKAFRVDNHLNFQTNDASPGQLTITSTYDISSTNFYDKPDAANVTYANSLVATKTGTNTLSISVSSSTDYGITVAGTAVTSANASNVLNDDYSSVSYNAATSTLTLKGVDLTSATNKNITATSALTIHLVGYSEVGEINVNDGVSKVDLKFTTNETLPGRLKFTNISGNNNVVCENGLSWDNTNKYIKSSSTNPHIIYAFGSYSNGDIHGYNNEGDMEDLDVYPGVDYVYSTSHTDFKVSSSSQSCYLYPASLNDMNLVTKVYFLFDWGTCNNKNVKVQVRGLKDENGYSYPIDDGKVYSGEMSLPSTGGLVEITLTGGAVTSEYVQLYFSSSAGEFSFIPISVGFQKATSYGISLAGTEVTSANASKITGTGISGTVTYDPSTNTLTLNGATIDGSGGITYNGSSLLTIALNGSNSVSTTDASGTVAFYLNGGTIKFIKATGANSASLTATCGSGGKPIETSISTLGSGLYWKPMARETMVITEDPEFVIVGDNVISGTVDGTNGTIVYDASSKTLTLNGYQKDFDAQHAIKTGVSGLKVKLVGASTITCSADSAVFRAFSSSASIQFIKDDATSKLTMTGTAYSNFGSSSITYDGLFYYSDNTNKYITQAAAPALSRVIGYSSGYPYTFATIDYAASDKSGGSVLYAAANPVLKYSFDYADPQKQDVSNQAYPDGGIQMTDPGILTTWVEIGTYKGPESKGVRFGLLENPIEMEFDGTAKQISITPAPTMTNPVTINVNSDSETNFNGFAVLDAQNNKITINNCYDGRISFTFTNTDGGYTPLNMDSTNVTFNVIPSKPTLSLESGLYYPGQQITATPTVPDVSYNSYFKINGNNVDSYTQPYTYTFSSAGVFDVSSVTYYIRGGNLGQIFGKYVEAKIIINTKPILNATVNTEPYVEGHGQVGDIYIDIRGDQNNSDPLVLQTDCKLYYYIGSNKNNAVEYDPANHIRLTESNTVTAYIVYTDPTDATIVYESEPVSASYIVNQQMADPFGANQNYKTYYLDEEYSMKKPDGLKVYVITGISGNSVTTTTLDYIPSKKPVLLEKVGEAVNGYYNAETYTGAEADLSGNLLKRAQGEVNADNNTYYVLYNNEFVKAVGLILNHGHYLDLNSVNPSRGMYSIGDGSTGIHTVNSEEGIVNSEVWFDMQGRRIDKPTRPGLYIKNGKKVVVNNK